MGLTANSTGISAVDGSLKIEKNDGDIVIALAGNPNVGKSTVFNALTGMNQHTGNWPGKTVCIAKGEYFHEGRKHIMVDLPGTYSLMANSAEEEVARDFICFRQPDAVVVVCDATCLERNLNLVLQTAEISGATLVCVNLLDEAEKKKIKVDLLELEKRLGVAVIGVIARDEKGLDELKTAIERVAAAPKFPLKIDYPKEIEDALDEAIPPISVAISAHGKDINPRWVALRLLERNEGIKKAISQYIGKDISEFKKIKRGISRAEGKLSDVGISSQEVGDAIINTIINHAQTVANASVSCENPNYYERDRKIDKILTHKVWGVPIMIGLLAVVFWITITGANYPSELLSTGLFWIGDKMSLAFERLGTPWWVEAVIVQGIYRVLAWVVSVMLPPMAIFFPMFTLLEDLGYLPRIAFNLDKHFKKACACGKQSLTMCMGFGCNAAGVVGCRIIDSPRERLIAIITNNFVPCNGRFPTLIAIITMFFAGIASTSAGQSVLSTLILVGVILLGIVMTFLVSRILSATILKGIPSSFTLELPPYRKPQIGKVIVRSIFDRTLFVLGRAVVVAAPCGLLIWIMANVTVADATILSHCSEFLDPFARFIGLDGVILLAFILGFPANEIVLPIIIMTYMAQGRLVEMSNLTELRELLVSNGWTWVTAICTMLFSLMHFPCSTTCMTIKKETASFKWTAISIIVPTVIGIVICGVVANVARLFI